MSATARVPVPSRPRDPDEGGKGGSLAGLSAGAQCAKAEGRSALTILDLNQVSKIKLPNASGDDEGEHG
jgi:hypothetical protein